MKWYTAQPLYFTDPGDLSASVNHAAADAMVAAAAGMWNVPTSAMVLAQGGTLSRACERGECIPGSDGPVFPSGRAERQLCGDADRGDLRQRWLGDRHAAGRGCEQPRGVQAECGDGERGFDHAVGLIEHAIVVLNGRCTGPAPEQQLQMQYQLERAFGRVLGVGWSQTNDNVFTQTPQPTQQQAQHWPIMHPIDIVCGALHYQCHSQPFTLRDDDVAAISTLYPYMIVRSDGRAARAGEDLEYTQAEPAC